MGLLPDGDAPRLQAAGSDGVIRASPKTSDDVDPTLREAMKTMVFWLFVIGMTVRVAAYSTISVHFIPVMVWKGLSQEHAAFLLGAFAFLNWVAHYVVGPIADMVNRPKLLAACMLAAAGSVLLLIWEDALWALWSFTILFTAIDASFPIVWATIGDFFGRKYFATIRGTMAFFYTWGGVLGPVIAGALYDRSQSYIVTLWGICGLLLLGALLTALLIKPWNDEPGKNAGKV
jgi:MFS family permease